MIKQIRILIAGRDKPILERLNGMTEKSGRNIAVRHIQNGTADPLDGIGELPDLLIFHAASGSGSELEALTERPETARPEIIVVGPGDDVSLMRAAMRAGARDFLPEPLDRDELLRLIESVQQQLRTSTASENGELYIVVGAKGGSGTSFIASNLAHVIARTHKKRVALLDMEMQFGCLSQYLDIGSRHGLGHVLEMAEDLDAVAMEACMAKHESGVVLLGRSQDESILPGNFSVDRLASILDHLKSNFSHTVVDLPRQVDPMTIPVYQRADRIIIIAQQDVASIRDANRLRQILMRELTVPGKLITIVLNRYNKKAAVELDDVCQSMNIEKARIMLVPNHFRDVAESINVGIPILENTPGSPVSKAIVELANRITGLEPERTGNLLSKALFNFIGG